MHHCSSLFGAVMVVVRCGLVCTTSPRHVGRCEISLSDSAEEIREVAGEGGGGGRGDTVQHDWLANLNFFSLPSPFPLSSPSFPSPPLS